MWLSPKDRQVLPDGKFCVKREPTGVLSFLLDALPPSILNTTTTASPKLPQPLPSISGDGLINLWLLREATPPLYPAHPRAIISFIPRRRSSQAMPVGHQTGSRAEIGDSATPVVVTLSLKRKWSSSNPRACVSWSYLAKGKCRHPLRGTPRLPRYPKRETGSMTAQSQLSAGTAYIRIMHRAQAIPFRMGASCFPSFHSQHSSN